MDIHTVPIIAMSAAVLSALAAAISARMAYKSWDYNKELNRANISLLNVKLEGRRTAPNQVELQFLFIFKNVGKETLTIDERTWAHFNFKNNTFTHAGNTHGLVNAIHPEAEFNHPAILYLNDIDSNLTDAQIDALLPEWIGRHAIIFRIKFAGGISGKNEIKYFLGYKGKSAVYQLADQEYIEMEPYLPDGFKLG